MQKVIKSKVLFVCFVWQWHAPRTQKSTPKASTGTPNTPKPSPQRDPGASKGDPRAPKERPQSVPSGPSRIQGASGRAFGRLRRSLSTFRDPRIHHLGPCKRPSNASLSLVLCSIFSPTVSLLPGIWNLARGLRTTDPRIQGLGPRTYNLRTQEYRPTQRTKDTRNRRPGGMCVAL